MTAMTLTEIAAGYRENAKRLRKKAAEYRRLADEEYTPSEERRRLRRKANILLDIAADNIATAEMLEHYYDKL